MADDEDQRSAQQRQEENNMQSLSAAGMDQDMDAEEAKKTYKEFRAKQKEAEVARKRREAELERVEVDEGNISVLAEHLEVSENKAERMLQENGGSLTDTLAAFVLAQ